MKYEIVNLEEKMIVGVSSHTSNIDPKMGEVIGSLWGRLYEGGIYSTIQHKINHYAIGLYSDYTEEGYCVTVGAEVSQIDNSELESKLIPAGKYAKFQFRGHIQEAVASTWGEILQLDLDRSFGGDFEEYMNCDGEEADICIYIGLK